MRQSKKGQGAGNRNEGDVARRDHIPIYARIRDELIVKISAGHLKEGSKLPTVREFAKERSINPMTVSRAYRELSERGYIVARPGSGSFVSRAGRNRDVRNAPAVTAEPDLEPGGISSRLFELARAPGVIAFTGNYPSVEMSDSAAFTRCLQDLLSTDVKEFFRYDPPAGRDELREVLSQFLRHHGIAAESGDLIVTSGGQQGLDIVVRHLVSPGDRVMIEQPAYFGVINVLRAAGAHPVPMALGPDGYHLEEVRQTMQRSSPRLVIVNPTFQNPTGRTVPLDQRRALLELAACNGIPILEDDPSPEIRYRGETLPPLRALPGGEELVYYTRGFGKAFVPGVRLGFLLPPAGGFQGCLQIKATTDLQSPALLQGALALYFRQADWRGYLDRLCTEYRRRQERLAEILTAELGDYARLALPDGGLNLWLELPGEVSAREVYFGAVRRGVAFAIADSFSIRSERPNALRIAFGLTDPQDFQEGARRLADMLRSASVRQRPFTSAVV